EKALVLFKSLQKAEELILAGERAESRLVPAMTDIISSGKPSKIDYITLAGYHDLQPVSHIEDRCVLAVAAYFGDTRLIDNMIIEIKGDTCECVY
ncbi:MAG: pantoate--beta-alanine ligase, partial [Spirochaetota bacterium]